MADPATLEPGKHRRVSAAFYYSIIIGIAIAGALRQSLSPGEGAYLLMHVIMSTIRMNFAQPPEGKIEQQVAPAREKALVALVVVGTSLLPFLSIATPLFDFARINSPTTLLMAGSCLAPVGLILFWRAHADLGDNWSPILERKEKQQLVTWGVYSKLRHPMYSAIFLLAFAQACLIGNWIVGLFGLFSVATLCALRIDDEEAMMRSEFGTEWERYAGGTSRLFYLPRSRMGKRR